MTFRTDNFKVGDSVTWVDAAYANLAGARDRYGDGPFAIVKIDDVDRHFNSVGHTQWPWIDVGISVGTTGDTHDRFSGAFFRLAR